MSVILAAKEEEGLRDLRVSDLTQCLRSCNALYKVYIYRIYMYV